MAGFGSTRVPLEPSGLSQNHRTFLASRAPPSPPPLQSQNLAPTKKSPSQTWPAEILEDGEVEQSV